MFRADRGVKKLNDQEKGALVGFFEAGWSNRRIAQRIGTSKSTVVYWKNRYEETGEIKRRVAPGSGNRRKTTPAEDQRIRDAVLARPITTAQEIAGLHFIFNIQCIVAFTQGQFQVEECLKSDNIGRNRPGRSAFKVAVENSRGINCVLLKPLWRTFLI